MTTAVVLFTRDLRIHDHPALAAACRGADRVVPLFVFDDAILSSRYAAPNRVHHLVEAVADLRATLRDRGGDLIVRRGAPAAAVRSICVEVAADELHVSADVSGFARRRDGALRAVTDDLGIHLHAHPGVTLVPPGDITPSGGDHFKVFTPYWRRWAEHPHRQPEPPPGRVPIPAGLEPGAIPHARELVDGAPAPDRGRGGETVARARLDAWFAAAEDGIGGYDDARNDLARDATSRLSAHLHFGTISVAEIAARIDRRRRGHEPFLRELCWRDFNHQLLAARPDLPTSDFRSQGDDWRGEQDEADAIAAWKEGRTGYPIVDAAMRQLIREGHMHNRARMIVASFLTKHLRIDWRIGAWHFMDHLEDGDLANNFAGWQWVAGTGTDTRPNRLFNPVAQAERYDPTGAYIRRYVPELGDLGAPAIHAPWEARDTLLAADYPAPIVDHREARARFLAERGR